MRHELAEIFMVYKFVVVDDMLTCLAKVSKDAVMIL